MLSRIFVIIVAFLLAAVAASVLFSLSAFVILLNSGSPWPSVSTAIVIFFQTGGMVFVPLTVFAFLPSMIVAAIAEIFRLRSVFLYIFSGATVAIASVAVFRLFLSLMMFQPKVGPRIGGFSVNWTMVVSGMLAGSVYWAIAGRNAGAWRQV
jgi:hypothetical protein